MPSRYHQIVPVTPQAIQVSTAYWLEKNKMLQATSENGMSANQRTRHGTAAGPLRTGLSDSIESTLAIAKRHACTAGAVILALGRANIDSMLANLRDERHSTQVSDLLVLPGPAANLAHLMSCVMWTLAQRPHREGSTLPAQRQLETTRARLRISGHVQRALSELETS